MNKLNEENNLNQEEPNAALSDEEIMQAEERFQFGNILYVVMDREKDVHRFNRGVKEWNFKENASFWHSWDCDPFVFNPLTGEEAVKLVHEWLSEK